MIPRSWLAVLCFLLTLSATLFSMASAGSDHMHGHMHNRNEWSQLVGQDSSLAADLIKRERPELLVVQVPHDSMMTMEFRSDRVRIFVDESGKVVRPPKIG